MLQVYTGFGKGKTTAALGLVTRALGAGLRVGVIAFDKGGAFYSEQKIFNALAQSGYPIRYESTGVSRFDPKKGTFRFGVTDVDIAEAERGILLAKQIMNEVDVLVLDEIVTAGAFGLLSWDVILSYVAERPNSLELIFTGRGADQRLLDVADLISEMVPRKHYFDKGVQAREGIEY